MRTPCGLPDHGRDIDRYEFSDLDKFELHCARARDTVSTWPKWKQNLLNISPTREHARVTFEIKDAERCESFDKLVQEHHVKRMLRLPPTEYYFNLAMERSKEIKDGYHD